MKAERESEDRRNDLPGAPREVGSLPGAGDSDAQPRGARPVSGRPPAPSSVSSRMLFRTRRRIEAPVRSMSSSLTTRLWKSLSKTRA